MDGKKYTISLQVRKIDFKYGTCIFVVNIIEFEIKTIGLMSSRLSFAHTLHYICMKIVASYAQKRWKSPTFIHDCVPHLPLPHLCLPTTRASLPHCQDLWFLIFFWFRVHKPIKLRAESKVKETKVSNRCFTCIFASFSCVL